MSYDPIHDFLDRLFTGKLGKKRSEDNIKGGARRQHRPDGMCCGREGAFKGPAYKNMKSEDNIKGPAYQNRSSEDNIRGGTRHSLSLDGMLYGREGTIKRPANQMRGYHLANGDYSRSVSRESLNTPQPQQTPISNSLRTPGNGGSFNAPQPRQILRSGPLGGSGRRRTHASQNQLASWGNSRPGGSKSILRNQHTPLNGGSRSTPPLPSIPTALNSRGQTHYPGTYNQGGNVMAYSREPSEAPSHYPVGRRTEVDHRGFGDNQRTYVEGMVTDDPTRRRTGV